MTETNWEKPKNAPKSKQGNEQMKFIVGGLLIVAAIAYLIISGTASGARYFITIEALLDNPDYIGETVRVSGAVLGNTIQYDSDTLTIEFTVSNIPDEFDDLAEVLHESVNNPNTPRVPVVVENQPVPDLLQHEAQAILTGELGEDGVFRATELLLKCPSRYEESVPEQVSDESSET